MGPGRVCATRLAVAFAFGASIIAAPAAGAAAIYWNMQTSSPTLAGPAGLIVPDVVQGNTSITGFATTSASSGYSFLLGTSLTAASGGNNLQFRAVAGPFSTLTSTYLQLTIENQTDSPADLLGLGFATRSTLTGPQAYAIRSSADAYGSDLPGGTGSLSTDSTWNYRLNTFSSPAAVPSGGSLSLRLFASGGTDAANYNWRLDDLQVQVVPEPDRAWVALAACAIGRLAWRRRDVSRRRAGT